MECPPDGEPPIPLDGGPPDGEPPLSQCVGGTHPTGMHSCFCMPMRSVMWPTKGNWGFQLQEGLVTCLDSNWNVSAYGVFPLPNSDSYSDSYSDSDNMQKYYIEPSPIPMPILIMCRFVCLHVLNKDARARNPVLNDVTGIAVLRSMT